MADCIGTDRSRLPPWLYQEECGNIRLYIRLAAISKNAENRRRTGVQSLETMSYICLPDEARQWLLANTRMNVDVRKCCTGIYDVHQMLSRERVSENQAKTYNTYGFTPICMEAARAGHIDCLRMAYETGIFWDGGCTEAAAASGNIECLRFAHENGCDWDENTCKAAAAAGQLECLQYAREHGCPWDEKTCAEATRYGHLECLRYAHENGCRWDRETVINALNYDQRECLIYAMSQGERSWELLVERRPRRPVMRRYLDAMQHRLSSRDE